MAAGAYLGPRFEFGPTSQLLRGVLIAAAGFSVWWWAVFLAWLLTRRGRPAGTSSPPAETSYVLDDLNKNSESGYV
jgi:hypothetical protein